MLPLIVKDFQWTQTPELVSLVVRIPKVTKNNVDVLTAPNYIRIHSHPYMFEAFLCGEVEDDRGSVTIDAVKGDVLIRLPKLSVGSTWTTFEKEGLDRDAKREVRESAVEALHERHKKLAEKRAKEKHEQKQSAIQTQLKMEEAERIKITEMKKAEVEKVLEDFESLELQSGETQSRTLTTDLVSPASKERVEDRLLAKHSRSTFSYKSYRSLRGGAEEISLREVIEKGPKNPGVLGGGGGGDSGRQPSECIWGGVAGMREESTIKVDFTPREFPTPARESNAKEENEWLKKQAEAKKLSGFDDADLRPEEKNPLWLLSKGRSLTEKGCHLGGVSAYSLGIKLAPKMSELYVERSQAHFILRNFMRAIEDASKGLELLVPKVEGNLEERFKCHLIRGRSFERLSLPREAVTDLKEAVMLRPEDLGVYEELLLVQAQKEGLARRREPPEDLLK